MTQQTLDIGLFAGLSPALKWSFLTLGLILQHIDGVGRSGLKGSTDPYRLIFARRSSPLEFYAGLWCKTVHGAILCVNAQFVYDAIVGYILIKRVVLITTYFFTVPILSNPMRIHGRRYSSLHVY